MYKIIDFRNGAKVQILTERKETLSQKWYDLICFNEKCPHGRFGFKMKGVNKVFNPYYFFDKLESKKIENYLNKSIK